MTPCADIAPNGIFSFSGFTVTISLPRSLLLGLSLALPACGGEGLILPPDGTASNIEVMSGNGQSGRVGSTLAESL